MSLSLLKYRKNLGPSGVRKFPLFHVLKGLRKTLRVKEKRSRPLSPGVTVQVRVVTRWRARQVTGTPLSRGWAGTAARSTECAGPARTPSGRPWNCKEAAGTPPGHQQRKRRLRSPGPPSTEHCGDPGGGSVERRWRPRSQPRPPLAPPPSFT